MNTWFSRLTLAAVILGFVVIVLGAYTRLSDAGLGCPDWPGCYGHMLVAKATPEAAKAWKEMVHRYVAGSFGLLIFSVAIFAWRRRFYLGLALIPLVLFQAALGMWTVTWQLLPLVVMGHLLGGITLVCCLWWLFLKSKQFPNITKSPATTKNLALAAFIVCALQIALGGWTSSNYAALACSDFPYCQGQWIPHLDLIKAFEFWSPIGVNYEYGVLDSAARATINTFHRFGGMITALVVLLFSFLNKATPRLNWALRAVVLIQVSLGILNITEALPISIAVLHNAVAVILLLLLLTANYLVRIKGDLHAS